MHPRMFYALFLSLIVLGCGEKSDPTTLSGLVNELGSDGLENVTFCLAGSDVICTQTDATGLYTLEGAAAGEDLSFTITKGIRTSSVSYKYF